VWVSTDLTVVKDEREGDLVALEEPEGPPSLAEEGEELCVVPAELVRAEE